MTTAPSLDDSIQLTRRPLVELLSLAGPTVAQMASYTVMQFIDTYMLSRVGDLQATAAGQSGMLSFAVISLGFGVLMVVNTLVSQNFGRHDFAACGRYLWQGVWFGLAFGLCTLPLLPFARTLFNTVGHHPELAELEAAFFRITVAAAALKLAAVSVGQFLLAVNRPNAVLVAAVLGVLATTGANSVLIYGHLGFPPLGVRGSAISTNIGVLVELAVLCFIAGRPYMVKKYHLSDWRPRPEAIGMLLKVGIPSGVQMLSEVLAWSAFAVVVVGHFDTAAMAATNYTFRFMSVSFMPVYGLSVAVTALVGRYIGMGLPDIAARRAHLGFALASVYTFACGLLMYLARFHLMGLFTHQPDVLKAGGVILVFAAAYQLFDAMYIIYNGALRGAGDTLVPAVAIAGMCWSINVGGGWLLAKYRPQFGVAGPWSTALTYGGILGVFLLVRFWRGGWRRIRLETPHAPEPSNPPVESARLSPLPVASEP